MGDGMIDRAALRVVALAVCAVLLAACTSTVPGTARPAEAAGPPPTSAAPPGRPDVDVIPAPELGVGTQVEAIRMAAATSLVGVLFPDRTDGCIPYGPFVDARDIEALYFLAGTAQPILDTYGFVAGWGQCQQNAANQATLALTMEVSDPDSAALAVSELVDAASDPDQQPTTLPTTGAAGLLRSADGEDTVQGWAAVGRTISYVFHTAPTGEALGGADRLMADQTALLAGFTPTPQDRVPALSPDPDGLRDLTLDPPGDLDTLTGPYALDSYIRLAIDPIRERDVLAANGFTGMFSKQSSTDERSYAVNLYAFPSSAQTNVAYVAFADLETAAFAPVPITVPSIPDAPCFAFDTGAGTGTPNFYQRCYVGYGSYLVGIDVGGVTALDDVAEMDRLLVAQRDLIDG
jgi:predicted small secreted protein